MSTRNRVVWSEGLFIKPQHFQQQQRYHEHVLNERLAAVSEYLYGITDFALNPEYLSFGRVALDRASGIMPDGTIFDAPREDMLPAILDVDDIQAMNQTIYLAVPLRSDAVTEISHQQEDNAGRYLSVNAETRDVHSVQGDSANIAVGKVRLRLMLENQDRSAFSTIAIGRLIEKRPDGSLLLDANFMPCHLNSGKIPALQRFLSEISGLMRERSRNIADRMGATHQGSVADVSDFMLLQVLNRLQPDLNHIGQIRSLHPERLYGKLVSVCGELATFTDESRQAPQFGCYNHDLPDQAFTPVISTLRQYLSIVQEPRAVSLQIQKRQFGQMVVPLHDPSLIDTADFVLAAKASMPHEDLRKLLVQQTKVASVEKIRELISLQLPGIPLSPLPVAPRQLPYHADFIYFRLDKSSRAWSLLGNASGFAFHIAGEFPGLELQFWAIRG